MLEVLPALRSEFDSGAVRVQENDLPGSGDVANLGDVDTRDSGRDSLTAGRREEQFIIVTSMQSEFEFDFAARLANLGARNRVRQDLRTNPALVANMPEIGGEAVAEIDHGRGETLFTQEPADLDSGDGMKMAGVIGWPKLLAGE